MSGMYTSGLIGLTEENVGIDRRFYTNRTDTNPTLAVSYNNGRVDVYLNGVKLVGNHAGNSNHDYTMDNVTGTGTTITLATGVALTSTDVLELVGYVSNSSNTVQTYNFNVTGNTTAFTASHTASSLVNVYLNGVLLDSSDYTLNGSDTVTLGSNAVNGDVVAIQVIGALDHSNFVPASGGNFTGNVTTTGEIHTDDIKEKTSAHGVEIDGVTLKDGGGTFTGDVGIGQSPGKKLDVGGDVRIRGDAGTLNFYRTTSPTDVATIEYNNSDSALKFWAKNKNINFSSADADQDSPHLYIKGTTGNVGIGTDSSDAAAGKLNVKDGTNAEVKDLITVQGYRYSPWQIRVDDTTSSVSKFQVGFSNNTEALSIADGGNVTITDGDLKIGTAGHGIDFSAGSHASGMTSELLDDYEEGTWSIDVQGATTAGTDAYQGTPICHYTKIGRQVTITFAFTLASLSGYSGSTFKFKGLPFNTMTNFESSGPVMLNNYNITNTFNALQVTTYIGGNYDFFYVYVSQDDGSWNQINADVTFGMIGSLTYFTS